MTRNEIFIYFLAFAFSSPLSPGTQVSLLISRKRMASSTNLKCMKKLSWHNKQGFLYFYVRAAILNRGVLLSANIYYIIERKSCLVVQYLSSE